MNGTFEVGKAVLSPVCFHIYVDAFVTLLRATLIVCLIIYSFLLIKKTDAFFSPVLKIFIIYYELIIMVNILIT
jgi:hypothetical protein